MIGLKEKFDVTGMTCAACQANVERAVSKIDGVSSVDVSLLSNSMVVEFDEKVDPSMICSAVDHIGYQANVHGNTQEESFKNVWQQRQEKVESEQLAAKYRLIYSLILLIPLMFIAMGPMLGLPILSGEKYAMISAITQLILSLSILFIQRHFFITGFKALVRKAPNMDSLVAIGSGASFIYALIGVYKMAYGFGTMNMMMVHESMHALYFESASMIVTLVSVGKYLESRSKAKTSESLNKLVDLAPKSAVVIRNDQEVVISSDQIMKGDIVKVFPGQRVPVDGKVISGTGYVDQSAITGESIPVEKNVGDLVISATMNENGTFLFEAVKVGQDTTLAQIIQLVDDAGNSKAPIARLADRVSGIFVPAVILIAIMTGIIWFIVNGDIEFALSNAISVLVISCPCALGLATPVAIMVGTGKAAENGILIKSAEVLEQLHSMDTVVFDKTGTITMGKPIVQSFKNMSSYSDLEFIQICASLESMSQHPLGLSIVEYAKNKKIKLESFEQFINVSGKGIEAKMNSHIYLAGNLKWMKERGIQLDQAVLDRIHDISLKGQTPLLFSEDDHLLGVIAVADAIRDSSPVALHALKEKGMHIVMLTGDNQNTAHSIASTLEIDEVISDVLPADKESVIRKLQSQGRKVIMVGDGINDAPALMRSDIGIAIGAGTDIAMDSADVVLMKSSLFDVVTAIDLSHDVIKNIKMNLFWAFFYNILGIPVAAGIFYPFFHLRLSPMIGSAAMSLSSVCVVSNALRLRWFKPKFMIEEKKIEEEKKMKKEIVVEGMMCPHCVKHVQDALSGVSGVSDVHVVLDTKLATCIVDDGVSDEMLINTIKEAGYTPVSIR